MTLNDLERRNGHYFALFRGFGRFHGQFRTAALKFCKTCVAMKFVDDDDDHEVVD